MPCRQFWSSVDLTGNQTDRSDRNVAELFWSSVDLTGNQTNHVHVVFAMRFGAVSI